MALLGIYIVVVFLSTHDNSGDSASHVVVDKQLGKEDGHRSEDDLAPRSKKHHRERAAGTQRILISTLSAEQDEGICGQLTSGR